MGCYVCGGCYCADVFDAVDFCDYFENGEIPGVVRHGGEVCFGDWDIVKADWWWVGMNGKEFHVDGVGIVWTSLARFYFVGKLLANRYHAFTIIVHILLDDFK